MGTTSSLSSETFLTLGGGNKEWPLPLSPAHFGGEGKAQGWFGSGCGVNTGEQQPRFSPLPMAGRG